MSNILLKATGVSKSFHSKIIPSVLLQDRVIKWRTHRERWSKKVLCDVSLTLRRGEWVGLYGANGSGKTTLLRILAGLLPADEGSVDVRGTLSSFFDITAGFHPERSAPENIYLHGLLHGRDPSAIRASVDDIITFAGVESQRDLPMKCFSAGQQLRVGFAASALMESDIYLFDEILAVGDRAFQEKCRNHLTALRQRGKTVLLVNHSLDELRRFCDRIVFLDEGSLVHEERITSDSVATPGPDPSYAPRDISLPTARGSAGVVLLP